VGWVGLRGANETAARDFKVVRVEGAECWARRRQMRRRHYFILSAGLIRDNLRRTASIGSSDSHNWRVRCGSLASGPVSAVAPESGVSGGRRGPAFRWRSYADLPLFAE